MTAKSIVERTALAEQTDAAGAKARDTAENTVRSTAESMARVDRTVPVCVRLATQVNTARRALIFQTRGC